MHTYVWLSVNIEEKVENFFLLSTIQFSFIDINIQPSYSAVYRITEMGRCDDVKFVGYGKDKKSTTEEPYDPRVQL